MFSFLDPHPLFLIMAKGKKRNRSTGRQWTATDHVAQEDKKQKTTRQQDRTALLTHNTLEKRDAAKLQLHLTKIQRAVRSLKHRLEQWDPVEEASKEKKRLEEEAQQKKELDGTAELKRKGRKGPETWKLRGAARPAWEVYDFDTRYVDPHIAAHKDAAEIVQRSQNILTLFQGRLCEQTIAPDRLVRDYLGMIMQLGYLNQEAKQYKSAREAWLECIDLEGDIAPATTARESLMRMYIDLNRLDAAYRLGERLHKDDSCMIRFSMALVACHLKKADTEQLMIQAIQCNIFAAYYLGYYDTFVGVMECTEDLQNVDEQPQSTFEEALEYCSSNHGMLWQKTAGAMEAIQRILRDTSKLEPAEMEWSDRLSKIEAELESRQDASTHATSTSDSIEQQTDNNESEEDESPQQQEEVDVGMFAGMFRTAMEMIEMSVRNDE